MKTSLLEDIWDEITQLLSELIKIDTTNPPGMRLQPQSFWRSIWKMKG
ncbi:hypothetical protein J7K27_03285 [Candidatus Bathyarchaeota archaeon]|nr:hypothetical protein [Candidatus Bathyarchaeota archaeon]